MSEQTEPLWGIKRVQVVCEGGPFDGRLVDELGVLASVPDVGGRFGWEHEGQWAMYRTTDRPAPRLTEPEGLWQMPDSLVAEFVGLESITDDQHEELAKLRGAV